jgi:hypothetical protein
LQLCQNQLCIDIAAGFDPSNVVVAAVKVEDGVAVDVANAFAGGGALMAGAGCLALTSSSMLLMDEVCICVFDDCKTI